MLIDVNKPQADFVYKAIDDALRTDKFNADIELKVSMKQMSATLEAYAAGIEMTAPAGPGEKPTEIVVEAVVGDVVPGRKPTQPDAARQALIEEIYRLRLDERMTINKIVETVGANSTGLVSSILRGQGGAKALYEQHKDQLAAINDANHVRGGNASGKAKTAAAAPKVKEAFRLRLEEKLPIPEIAKRIGVAASTAGSYLRGQSKGSKDLFNKHKKQLEAVSHEVAMENGKRNGKRNIGNLLQGKTKPKPAPANQSFRSAKLTDEQVLEIYGLLVNTSYTQTAIANTYKIGQGQVSNIKAGRAYSHLFHHYERMVAAKESGGDKFTIKQETETPKPETEAVVPNESEVQGILGDALKPNGDQLLEEAGVIDIRRADKKRQMSSAVVARAIMNTFVPMFREDPEEAAYVYRGSHYTPTNNVMQVANALHCLYVIQGGNRGKDTVNSEFAYALTRYLMHSVGCNPGFVNRFIEKQNKSVKQGGNRITNPESAIGTLIGVFNQWKRGWQDDAGLVAGSPIPGVALADDVKAMGNGAVMGMCK